MQVSTKYHHGICTAPSWFFARETTAQKRTFALHTRLAASLLGEAKTNFMGNTSVSNAQKKEFAKTLYLKEDLDQKAIARKIGISEQTISKWANEGNWKGMKKSLLTSKQDRLIGLYDQLAWVEKKNKEAIEDDDPETNPNYDAIAKISKSIERLEKDAGVGDMIKTVIALINFVEKEDIEAAKTVSHWGYIFIQDKMKDLK